MSTDAVRAALAELVACHTEEAGLTMSMVANRADFDAFMERCDQRLAAALDAARAALSAGDAESKARIDDAMRVLAAVHERQAERGSWTLRGPELQALDDGLWVARVQLAHCSLGEFERARKQVAQRIRHARAGNVPEGAHVVGSGQ